MNKKNRNEVSKFTIIYQKMYNKKVPDYYNKVNKDWIDKYKDNIPHGFSQWGTWDLVKLAQINKCRQILDQDNGELVELYEKKDIINDTSVTMKNYLKIMDELRIWDFIKNDSTANSENKKIENISAAIGKCHLNGIDILFRWKAKKSDKFAANVSSLKVKYTTGGNIKEKLNKNRPFNFYISGFANLLKKHHFSNTNTKTLIETQLEKLAKNAEKDGVIRSHEEIMRLERQISKYEMAPEERRTKPPKTYTLGEISPYKKEENGFDFARYFSKLFFENLAEKNKNIFSINEVFSEKNFYKNNLTENNFSDTKFLPPAFSILIYNADFLDQLAIITSNEALFWDLIKFHIYVYAAKLSEGDKPSTLIDKINASIAGYKYKLYPLEEKVYRATRSNEILRDELTRRYKKKYPLSEKKKRKIVSVFEDIINAAIKLLKSTEWLSEETKRKCKIKVQNMELSFQPEEFEYSNSDFKKIIKLANGDYFLFNFLCRKLQTHSAIKKIKNQSIIRDYWSLYIGEANAYYSGSTNKIVITGALLDPPIFDDSTSGVTSGLAESVTNIKNKKDNSETNEKIKAKIMGKIGVIIAHEIFHGFDDSGRKYDEYGRKNKWWHDDEIIEFKKRANDIIRFYSDLYVFPNGQFGVFCNSACRANLEMIKQDNNDDIDSIHNKELIAIKSILSKAHKLNGENSVGENIADIGGLKVAESTIDYANLDIFYTSFAELWKRASTEEYILEQIKTDPHLPSEIRTNFSLYQLEKYRNKYSSGDFTEAIFSLW